MRGMCVLVRESKYQLSTGKLVSKYYNVNVLVGKNVKKVKAKIEEFTKTIGGSFES